ncbi:MAG: hypothetical protein ABR991_01695 [Terracidiphilus sp.]|jgi:hypothetical protein
MSENKRQNPSAENERWNQPSDYVFKASSPAEDCLEIANIHHREAKQLFVGAREAEAEGRQEESKLLHDLAVAREATAVEFETAAKGEGSDPVVTEILDWQKDLCQHYVPHSLSFVTGNEPPPPQFYEEVKQPQHGPLARAVGWVGSWIAH